MKIQNIGNNTNFKGIICNNDDRKYKDGLFGTDIAFYDTITDAKDIDVVLKKESDSFTVTIIDNNPSKKNTDSDVIAKLSDKTTTIKNRKHFSETVKKNLIWARSEKNSLACSDLKALLAKVVSIMGENRTEKPKKRVNELTDELLKAGCSTSGAHWKLQIAKGEFDDDSFTKNSHS